MADLMDDLDNLDDGLFEEGGAAPEAGFSEEVVRILKIELPVVVNVAETARTIEEIRRWTPGQIIEFSKSSEDVLDLVVGDQHIARGEVVQMGEKFGLQISEIGPVEETIRKLAGG